MAATTKTDASISLDALTPDPRNACRHTERNLATIEASLREVGAARSIVVDENETVLAGNATVRAVLANSARPDDAVLGCFSDSGLTLLAREALGRKARLLKLDLRYCDARMRRWEQATGKTAERMTLGRECTA